MSKWCNAAWVAVWRGSENLSRTSGGCLAWIIRVRRRARGKAGDPCVTVQVVKTGITPPRATSDRLRAAETEPLHPAGRLHMRR